MTQTPTIEQEAAVTSEPVGSSMDDQMILDAIPPTKRARVTRRPLVISATLLLLAVATVIWFLHSRHFPSTDDAEIDGNFDAISTRIAGTVTYINPDVENDRFIQAGTLLMELDPRDNELIVEHANANVATKLAEADSAKVNVPIADVAAYSRLRLAQAARAGTLATVSAEKENLSAAEHKVSADEAIAARAERDRARYEGLVQKHEISRSEYDGRETEAVATSQTLEADRAKVAAERQTVTQSESLVQQRQAQVDAASTAPQQAIDARAKSQSAVGQHDQALAELHTAQLNLSYTKIYSAVSGVVGRKTVEMGHRIHPGQTLLTIVPIDNIWITANFKETQLRLMRPGQPVTIWVDTFGRDYTGTVEDLAGAAGPLFSLFPPENASGNYVKGRATLSGAHPHK